MVCVCAGKKLRKVEHEDEVKKQEYRIDVASILKRKAYVSLHTHTHTHTHTSHTHTTPTPIPHHTHTHTYCTHTRI